MFMENKQHGFFLGDSQVITVDFFLKIYEPTHNITKYFKKRTYNINYYTTLLKSVEITRKTSTNIQRYSDSWLFVQLVICIVGNRSDKLTCAKHNTKKKAYVDFFHSNPFTFFVNPICRVILKQIHIAFLRFFAKNTFHFQKRSKWLTR